MKEYKKHTDSFLYITNYTHAYFINFQYHGFAYTENEFKGYYNIDMEYGHWLDFKENFKYYL